MHTSQPFAATNHVEAWGRVILNQDGAYSTDVTLMTFPKWLRRAQLSWFVKKFRDLALSEIARQAADFSESSHTSRQVKIFCRSTENRLECGGIKSFNCLRRGKQTVLHVTPHVSLSRENYQMDPFARPGNIVQSQARWDDKATSTSPARRSFVLEDPSCNLRPSMPDFASSDGVVLRAYYALYACGLLQTWEI